VAAWRAANLAVSAGEKTLFEGGRFMDKPIATPMFGWMRSKVREERPQSKEDKAKPRRSLLSWLELLLVPPLPPLTGDPERDAEIMDFYFRSLSEW